MKALIILLGVILAEVAHAGFVTLTAQSRDGTNGITQLAIGAYEVAELVSFPRSINFRGSPGSGSLRVIKDGKSFDYISAPYSTSDTGLVDPLVVAGPATIQLRASNDGIGTAFCTLRVSPESFPPDRTILVPPGTNQSQITLECSTNLVQWFPATNGVYGPLPEAKFFRIRLERLQ